MPPLSKDQLAAQFKNNSLYLIMNSRGALPGYHWGIFIPTESPLGEVWHATNREGGWKLENKRTPNVPFSISLVWARKVGTVDSNTWQACRDTLNAVRADGSPSPYTGETFDCLVWVSDALTALQEKGLIVLPKPFSTLKAELVSRADILKPRVESGEASPKVQDTDASA